MLGFIRRLFGIYTIEEKREQGRRYAMDLIDTAQSDEQEGIILMDLADEWRALRTNALDAGSDRQLAYADGIQDALEEWLQRKDAEDIRTAA